MRLIWESSLASLSTDLLSICRFGCICKIHTRGILVSSLRPSLSHVATVAAFVLKYRLLLLSPPGYTQRGVMADDPPPPGGWLGVHPELRTRVIPEAEFNRALGVLRRDIGSPPPSRSTNGAASVMVHNASPPPVNGPSTAPPATNTVYTGTIVAVRKGEGVIRCTAPPTSRFLRSYVVLLPEDLDNVLRSANLHDLAMGARLPENEALQREVQFEIYCRRLGPGLTPTPTAQRVRLTDWPRRLATGLHDGARVPSGGALPAQSERASTHPVISRPSVLLEDWLRTGRINATTVAHQRALRELRAEDDATRAYPGLPLPRLSRVVPVRPVDPVVAATRRNRDHLIMAGLVPESHSLRTWLGVQQVASPATTITTILSDDTPAADTELRVLQVVEGASSGDAVRALRTAISLRDDSITPYTARSAIVREYNWLPTHSRAVVNRRIIELLQTASGRGPLDTANSSAARRTAGEDARQHQQRQVRRCSPGRARRRLPTRSRSRSQQGLSQPRRRWTGSLRLWGDAIVTS